MRKLILTALFLLSPAVASASGSTWCFDPPDKLVDNLAMTSSRTAAYSWSSINFSTATLFIKLTDANTSITSFVVTCTVSNDGGTTDYYPQDCSGGACTDIPAFSKASPGTKNFTVRLDVDGYSSYECVLSVGGGSAAAGDVVTVTTRLCTK